MAKERSGIVVGLNKGHVRLSHPIFTRRLNPQADRILERERN